MRHWEGAAAQWLGAADLSRFPRTSVKGSQRPGSLMGLHTSAHLEALLESDSSCATQELGVTAAPTFLGKSGGQRVPGHRGPVPRPQSRWAVPQDPSAAWLVEAGAGAGPWSPREGSLPPLGGVAQEKGARPGREEQAWVAPPGHCPAPRPLAAFPGSRSVALGAQEECPSCLPVSSRAS